jgi:hypothetical protein
LIELYTREFKIGKEIISKASITAINDREIDGNAMLESCLSSQKDRDHKRLLRRLAQLQFANEFYAIFKVPLSKFYDRLTGGFDSLAFDEEFIRSGDRSCRDVIVEKFGERAAHVVEVLLNPEKYESEIDRRG